MNSLHEMNHEKNPYDNGYFAMVWNIKMAKAITTVTLKCHCYYLTMDFQNMRIAKMFKCIGSLDFGQFLC